MPSMSIEVNGIRIATIGLSGMHVVDVSVHGALDREPKASLSAFGGNYEEGACGHLIWIDEHPLRRGDVVSVEFHELCEAADQGRTIEELYPDEPPCTRSDFAISDEMAAEIRSRPRLHDAFAVQVETSSGQTGSAESDDLNTDFRFGIVWDSFRPTQARIRLSTYCFDDVLARTGGHEHFKTALDLGDSVSFSVLR